MPGGRVLSISGDLSSRPPQRRTLWHYATSSSTTSAISYCSATCAAGQALQRNFVAEEPSKSALQGTLYFWLYLSEPSRTANCVLRTGIQRGMTSFCTIEYDSGNTERRCGRAAVAECGHCGASVCSSCAKEWCAQVLCGYCYDYHVIHSCLRRLRQRMPRA
jgi:hypothetical protein